MHRVPETLISSGLGFLFILFFFFFFSFFLLRKSKVIIVFKIQSVHLLFFSEQNRLPNSLDFFPSPSALVYHYSAIFHVALLYLLLSDLLLLVYPSSVEFYTNSPRLALFLFFPLLFVSLYFEILSTPLSALSFYFLRLFLFQTSLPFSAHPVFSVFRIFT